MVERCADCGFDLAAGRVEVVPTAHYMMGGVEFAPDCTTGVAGLFVAGEDSGGVHGANRLGGNGVANSTVFGGIAGDTMAAWVARSGEWREPDAASLERAVARAEAPLAKGRGDPRALESIRQRLYDAMWNDAGIVRDAVGLSRAARTLESLRDELATAGVADRERAFNLSWHDALNLDNLIAVSRIIVAAASARENSRGAHYRTDFPDEGDLATSAFVRIREHDGALAAEAVPVTFSRVAPGETLLSV
jgi:fumarate reductase flavoprotein subunit